MLDAYTSRHIHSCFESLRGYLRDKVAAPFASHLITFLFFQVSTSQLFFKVFFLLDHENRVVQFEGESDIKKEYSSLHIKKKILNAKDMIIIGKSPRKIITCFTRVLQARFILLHVTEAFIPPTATYVTVPHTCLRRSRTAKRAEQRSHSSPLAESLKEQLKPQPPLKDRIQKCHHF